MSASVVDAAAVSVAGAVAEAVVPANTATI